MKNRLSYSIEQATKHGKQRVNWGLLSASLPTVNGRIVDTVISAENFFTGDISKYEKRVVEIGLEKMLLSRELGSMKVSDISSSVREALGAANTEIETFELLDNEAWFLTAFLSFRHQYNFHLKNDLSKARDRAIALGQLIFWWEMRSEGIEKAALSEKQRVTQVKDNQPKATRAKITKKLKWREYAISIAQDKIREAPNKIYDLTNLANEIIDFVTQLSDNYADNQEIQNAFSGYKSKNKPPGSSLIAPRTVAIELNKARSAGKL